VNGLNKGKNVAVVVIGDVGVLDDMVHIGDEAMFEQQVVQLRDRGIRNITGISANPRETAARYGIDAIERIGFTGTRDEMVARMERVRAGDVDPTDPAHGVIEAIRASDGVAIAGGGNMSSIWPMHIFERATIGALAARFGKPLVVSGQTIGPVLTDDDAVVVAELLSSARLVGLREGASFALCTELGLTGLTQTVDDASYLAFAAEPTQPHCLVTLANHVGDHDRDSVEFRYAELLDLVFESTGLEIVFSPHFGSLLPNDERGDSAIHARVRARMTRPAREIPATDSAASARLARAASLVISSRYHPAVFAVSAGVPTIGVAVDDYTTVKLTGALGNFAQHSVLSAERLVAGEGPALAAAVWGDREAIRERGAAASVTNRAASDDWWNRVYAALVH
jgi:polysaccharide pyruvyl transferase WcaK-like protein